MVSIQVPGPGEEFVDLANHALLRKNILITGGSSGIGRATVKKLLKAGANVFCFTRSEQKFNDLATYRKSKGTVRAIRCDLERPADLKQAFNSLMRDLDGKLHGIINCAGIAQSKDYRDTLLDEWDRIFTVNARAPMHLMSMAVPYLRNRKHSAIVNVSDTPVPKPKQTITCVAKACLDSLTQCSALELAPFNIRVNGVAPGCTETDLRLNQRDLTLSAEDEARFLSRAAEATVLKRVNKPSDVANTIVWLVSKESSFVNGEIITVDSGASVLTAAADLQWHAPEALEEPAQQERPSALSQGLKRLLNL